ncbi:MAG: hypothetical protein JRI23_16525 [Deltaproteobacteria bacterium]|nr:hypothetical protein [Deltaproteobacteria bacterium]
MAAPPQAPPSSPAAQTPAERHHQPSGLAGTDISLETYAAIKASLWDGTQSLEEVLERHAIEESAWRTLERRKSAAIAREASTGRTDLADQIRLAIASARREQAGGSAPAEEMTVAEFAALQVAVDEADDAAAVLKDEGLDLESWSQLQRQWAHRAKADGRLAASLRRELAAARKAAAEGSDL